MAAPTFVAAGTITTTNNGGSEPAQSISVALPAGVQANDILIMHLVSGYYDQPFGWHQFIDGGMPNPTGIQGWIWWKRATASETDPVVVSRGATGQRVAYIAAFRGCPTTGYPFDATNSGGQAAGATLTAGGVTTTSNDCMIVVCSHSGADNVTGQRMSALTNANLTSLTERVDQWVSTGGGAGAFMATGVKATAGATGNTTATCSAVDAQSWITISLRPAASPESVPFAGPRYMGRGTAVNQGISGTVTPGLPSGWIENDIFFCAVRYSGGSISVSGWTRVTGFPDTGGDLFWRRATSTESAPSVVQTGGTNGCVAQVMAMRGCRTSGDPWSDISSIVADATSDAFQNAPAITTSLAHSFVMHFIWNGLDNITGERVAQPSNTSIVDVIEMIDAWTSAGSGHGVATWGGNCLTPSVLGGGFIVSINGNAVTQASTNSGVTLALPPDDGAEANVTGQFQAYWFSV